ncbi:MAG: type II toxin-antitoxin system Phd/YefM family antitoxin [Verrucomicrobiales bacterium]
MTQVNLHEVKARLSHYSRLVKKGETIILCDRNKPFAEIRPIGDSVKKPKKRKLGLMKGWFPCPDNFNDPDPEMEADWNEGPIFPSTAAGPTKP